MIAKILHVIIEILIVLVFIHAIGSWIPQIRESRFYEVLDSIVDPLLRPIRQVLPTAGGIDFSPMVLIFILILIDRLLLKG